MMEATEAAAARLTSFASRQKTHVQLIGESAPMIALQQEIERVARSDAKVLITGESGVGKELVARGHPHAAVPRVDTPFVAGQLRRPPRDAARIRAVRPREGQLHRRLSRQAGQARDRRTTAPIFLDEIGEMTLRMQGLLLRFLETGELQKVGAERRRPPRQRPGRSPRPTATCASMIAQGTFREDLFYRLNVIHLVVPPLRERREDIPALVDHFLAQLRRDQRLADCNGIDAATR